VIPREAATTQEFSVDRTGLILNPGEWIVFVATGRQSGSVSLNVQSCDVLQIRIGLLHKSDCKQWKKFQPIGAWLRWVRSLFVLHLWSGRLTKRRTARERRRAAIVARGRPQRAVSAVLHELSSPPRSPRRHKWGQRRHQGNDHGAQAWMSRLHARAPPVRKGGKIAKREWCKILLLLDVAWCQQGAGGKDRE